MAILPTPESSTGILGAIRGSLGLFSETNKALGIDENNAPMPEDLYESSLNEMKVLQLVAQWKKTYSVYYTDIEKGQKMSFDYWVGKHRNPDAINVQSNTANNPGITDNLLFEAIETFLPIATRANPEPLVSADPGDIGQALAHDIKVALAHEADVQGLRRKLAKTTRGWLLNRIGVMKVCWDPETKEIRTDVINGKKIIFDIDGYINEQCEFVGEYIGEKKRATAELLTEMFPRKATVIAQKAKHKMATKLDYFEWWYRGTDLLYTLDDDTVLGKYKNPNWNYDGEIEEKDPETGAAIPSFIQGSNHLKKPSAPYRFLSIFNTGEQPHDNTSLILQNIPQQDKINRREVQIDKNVQGMNDGLVVSGTYFTEEQASQAASALRRGVAIRVPEGDVDKAVMFPNRPGLPNDVFANLQDARSELRNIFGITGSTAEGVKSQETVRGKIMVNQMDSSRIGGGITEFIEQLADSIYNLWVQFMFVYYDEEHFITSAGAVSGQELITLKNDRFPLMKTLTVTVKDGSLIPKDPLTQRNEAIDLWSANAIDPRSLYKKLDFPDPDEATNQLILWQMLQKGQIQPQMYLPSFAPAGGAPTDQPLPTEMPGTGGAPVSDVSGAQVGAEPPAPNSPDAVNAQSKELIGAQPLQ